MSSTLQEAVKVIKEMRGVQKVLVLPKGLAEEILVIEKDIKSQAGKPVINTGIEAALIRDHVICIIKNKSFRPPPEPTVVWMADDGMIIGTEVILPEDHLKYQARENTFWLSPDFVVFTDVIPKHREYFVMPPVSFPEVAELKGAKDVVSCSPSPLGDLAIKKHYTLEDDPKLASILVGFNDD
ncbi:MAG: hypothetical protein WCK39_00920 [Methanomassiliicoccales archaeon]